MALGPAPARRVDGRCSEVSSWASAEAITNDRGCGVRTGADPRCATQVLYSRGRWRNAAHWDVCQDQPSSSSDSCQSVQVACRRRRADHMHDNSTAAAAEITVVRRHLANARVLSMAYEP